MIPTQSSIKIYADTKTELNKYKYDLGRPTGKNTSIDAAIRDLLEIAASKKYYCVYQDVGSTLVIFGIGRTEAEAWRDVDPTIDSKSLSSLRCTAEVYAHVVVYGGQTAIGRTFQKSNGVIVLDTNETN